jgi:hypothetical protein
MKRFATELSENAVVEACLTAGASAGTGAGAAASAALPSAAAASGVVQQRESDWKQLYASL